MKWEPVGLGTMQQLVYGRRPRRLARSAAVGHPAESQASPRLTEWMISRRVPRQIHTRKHMNNLAHTKANKHCGGRGFEKIIIPILDSRNIRVRIVPRQSDPIVVPRRPAVIDCNTARTRAFRTAHRPSVRSLVGLSSAGSAVSPDPCVFCKWQRVTREEREILFKLPFYSQQKQQ